jgi:Ca2+-transporting ATPase
MTESPWHTRTVAEVVQQLSASLEQGLTGAEAAARLTRYGPNALTEAKQRSAFTILLHQFRSLMIVLLVVASGVAFAVGEVIEGVAVVVVILLNAVIGFATEWKAGKALAGLRDQTIAVARVLRDGSERELPSKELVPGDVVLLEAGERGSRPTAAWSSRRSGCRSTSRRSRGSRCPVAKSAEPVADLQATALGDRSSMVHTGTAVTGGRGTMLVTGTGARTEMGKIGTLMGEVDEQRTPLEGKLAQLSRALLIVVLVLCAVMVLIGWLRGNPLLLMVEVGISLAIAAVPEGLAVTTMTLAVGMQRMARMHALVRRLPAVETLGSTTVICTDKTGTLTRNEMTVRVVVAGERRVVVTGAGYGVDRQLKRWMARPRPEHGRGLALALRIGACATTRSSSAPGSDPTVLGDPTEAALIVARPEGGDGA